MNVLDLFSGIGGFSLGLEKAGMKTVAFCERDKRCLPILNRHWPGVPVFDDIMTLTNEALYDAGIGSIDVVCGGFPCQDISAAWDGPGLAGKRSGLWFEFARLIHEIKPRYAIIENVANLRKRGLDVVLQDLARMGFDADWAIIPAAAVGAPHQRDRLWIVAKRRWEPVVHSAECFDDDTGEESFCPHCRGDFGECDCFGPSSADDAGWECVEEDWGAVAYPDSAGRGEQLWPVSILPEQLPAECYRWYQHEPEVGRVADGFPGRSHRIQKLGNAVTPFIPRLIGAAIMDAEMQGLLS
jgi:DNA (cytosine-5)-methyltransferase 1